MRRLFFILVCAFFWSINSPSPSACLFPEGTPEPPTDYGLVKMADAIVVAEAREPEFQILKVLKGNISSETLRSPDFRSCRRDDLAFEDSCGISKSYACGERYVLFLRKREDEWDLLKIPNSRIHEYADEIDSPWVRIVEVYVAVGALNDDGEERKALQELLEGRLDIVEVHSVPGLAENIRHHLRITAGRK
jgi:hypothetical protein